jgi:hypothetical protein
MSDVGRFISLSFWKICEIFAVSFGLVYPKLIACPQLPCGATIERERECTTFACQKLQPHLGGKFAIIKREHK